MPDEEAPPRRFGLVFQFHPLTPGLPAQQTALRQGITDFGYGTPRWRMLWFFAREYKKRQDYNYGGLAGSLHHVNISIEGMNGNAFANAMVLPSWATDADLWLTFCHEWGHIFDRYTMNAAIRSALMVTISETNPWAAGNDWQGDPAPHNYWYRPQELFAWSFQRLCVPELAEMPGGFTREVMAEVLPDWDQAWTEAGLPITDE